MNKRKLIPTWAAIVDRQPLASEMTTQRQRWTYKWPNYIPGHAHSARGSKVNVTSQPGARGSQAALTEWCTLPVVGCVVYCSACVYVRLSVPRTRPVTLWKQTHAHNRLFACRLCWQGYLSLVRTAARERLFTVTDTGLHFSNSSDSKPWLSDI